MGQLYVYDSMPDAVDTLGLCGPLSATSCKYSNAKNAEMELTIQHPIDATGKWANLTDGNIIRTNVPLRTTPIIHADGLMVEEAYPTNIPHWRVKSGAARTDRSVYSTVPGVVANDHPIRLCVLEPGVSVYVIGTLDWAGFPWSAVAWSTGRGWILTAAIESVETLSLAGTRSDVEGFLPSPRMRPQLFRIYAVTLTESGVTAKARHVSYDFIGSVTSVPKGERTFSSASSYVFGNAVGDVTKYAAVQCLYNETSTKDVADWTRIGAIEAVLAPSNSLVGLWPVVLLRDNWVFTFLTDWQYNSGYVIEYGRNLLGVSFESDTTDVWSAIIPVGQTSKGKPLIVPFGDYTVDGATIHVSADGAVFSPTESYPVPHIGVLDLGSSIKAAGTTSAQLLAAYTKLIRAALAKFADEKCDLPAVTLRVDFLRLGDTAEYAQYRELGKVFLHDLVRVRHPVLGIDVTAEVNKITWDCLLDRYDSIEVGSVRRNYARSRLAPWQVPGLASLQSYVDTISSLI